MADTKYVSAFTGQEIDEGVRLARQHLPLVPPGSSGNVALIKDAVVALQFAGWSGNTQTVSVSGVTASSNVVVSPAPASFEAYASAVVRCTAQEDGSLTFTSKSAPAEDLTVNILILEEVRQ